MKNEQGATMIIVLVVLLLVAVAGAIAMRSGIFGSRLSLNHQIGGLLMHNSDSALAKFEDMPGTEVAEAFALGGVFDRLLQPAYASDELVFCYDATNSATFSLTNAETISSGSTPSTGSNKKFCNKNSYSSSRQTDITQIHLKRNNDISAIAQGNTISTNIPSVDTRINVSLIAISIMPKTASSDVSGHIDACLAKSAFGTDTVSACLTTHNIPHEVHKADYESGNLVTIPNR